MPRFRATPLQSRVTTLVVIERIGAQRYHVGSGVFVQGSLEPLAIVTRGPEGPRAVDMENRPLSLAELRQTVPGLDELIDSAAGRTKPERTSGLS